MTNEQRAQMAIGTARATLGAGWAHVSVAVRRGLAMADLVGMVLGQDESISSERRLAILAGTAERIDANLGWSEAAS